MCVYIMYINVVFKPVVLLLQLAEEITLRSSVLDFVAMNSEASFCSVHSGLPQKDGGTRRWKDDRLPL